MPTLNSYNKLLIFGGTFDPPHWGHVRQPERVREALGFEAVVYLPAGQSPHKQGQASTPAEQRLAMVRAAVADQPFAVVSDLELHRPPPSYTVDTLEALRSELKPGAQMRLLIGADQARVFDQWYRADRITELAEPVVMVRPPDSILQLEKDLPPPWPTRLIPVPPMDIAATQIRDLVREQKPIDDLVPPAVADLIENDGLYQSNI